MSYMILETYNHVCGRKPYTTTCLWTTHFAFIVNMFLDNILKFATTIQEI